MRVWGLRSSTCFLVDLNRCLVLINPNNLADKCVMADTTLCGQHLGFSTILELGLPTNSYIAQPIICSATTTGPDTEKIEPCFSELSEVIMEEVCVEWEDTEGVKVVEEGESGSGGSSGGDGVGGDGCVGCVGCVNVCFAVTRSNNDARTFNRGRPKPSIRWLEIEYRVRPWSDP
jgi:hypothetical protein